MEVWRKRVIIVGAIKGKLVHTPVQMEQKPRIIREKEQKAL